MTVVGGPATVRIPLEDRGGRPVGAVVAAGHERPAVTDDLAAGFPHPTGPLPEVALLHAQAVGSRSAEAHERYAPVEIATLERSGYAYWALGHVHVRQRVSSSPETWYPGNLQGRNPRETGAKGALLVELDQRGATDVEFRPLAPIRWETLLVEGLEHIHTVEALARAVDAAWRSERSGDPGLPGTEWILRVELRGPSPLFRELDQAEERAMLEELLSGRLGLLDVEIRADGVHPPVDPEAHLERQDALGEALRLLRDAHDDTGALRRLRPDELAGAPPGGDEDDYLRSLLEGAEADLVARMLDPDAAGEP